MEKEIHGFIGVANYAMQRLLDGMFRIPDFLVLFECVTPLLFVPLCFCMVCLTCADVC